MTTPALPEALFTTADLVSFQAHAGQWRQDIEDLPRKPREEGLARLKSLEEQGAWLLVEQAFDQHPDLDRVLMDVEDTGGDYHLSVFFIPSEDAGGPYASSAELNSAGDALQEELNEMGRASFRGLFERMANQTIYRDDLEEVAGAVLGEKWASQRQEQALERALPEAGPARPRPLL